MANYKVEVKFTNGDLYIFSKTEEEATKLVNLYSDSKTFSMWVDGLFFQVTNVVWIKVTLENQQDD